MAIKYTFLIGYRLNDQIIVSFTIGALCYADGGMLPFENPCSVIILPYNKLDFNLHF